jgi:hypothetical protein
MTTVTYEGMTCTFRFVHFTSRWRHSTAYTDLPAEAQGLLLNLLFEIQRRGGSIPADDRILSNVSGDASAWGRNKDTVLKFLTKTPDGYRSTMIDSLVNDVGSNAVRQRRHRERANATAT